MPTTIVCDDEKNYAAAKDDADSKGDGDEKKRKVVAWTIFNSPWRR